MNTLTKMISVIKGLSYKIYSNLYSWDYLPIITERKQSQRIIVTLTSHGRRVEKVVWYTLFSLFRQSVLPDKIILWLDKDNWSENKLPDSLKFLTKKGLEIKFCKDSKSYTKLLPSLKLYPKDILITVDDDVIYPKYFIERMYNSYLAAPDKIHTVSAREVIVENNQIKPYSLWKTANNSSKFICPNGFGGVLYPPNSLSKKITNEDVFMKLCPYADDIWFFIMGILNNSKYQLVNIDRNNYFGVDYIYQYFHKESTLSNHNVKDGGNDDQLQKCLSYFNISSSKYFN